MTNIVAAIRAGAVYFAVVFVLGFILGTVRVVWVAPQLGEATAVFLEAPIILAFSWAVSRWCVSYFQVQANLAARLLMGLVAFVLLMSAELGVSVTAFGRSVADHFAGYLSLPGSIGGSAQLIFAFLPVIQGWARGRH